MKITYLGTTVLLFDDGIDQVIFDAHFTRPNMIRFKLGKVETDPAIVDRVIHDFRIDRLRGVFISHTHSDHVLDAPYLAKKCGADFYGSASAMNVARGGQVAEEKLHCYDEAYEYRIGDFEIRVIPSRHSKAHWYNNDLGKTIDQPLYQPARTSAYKEGGSYDFLVKHRQTTYLIRPSFHYIEGQLDGIKADVLFLGVAGMSKAGSRMKRTFFRETIEKVKPGLVIPLHWDNFFKPLYGPGYNMPFLFEDTKKSLNELAKYCAAHRVSCVVQLPLTSIQI